MYLFLEYCHFYGGAPKNPGNHFDRAICDFDTMIYIYDTGVESVCTVLLYDYSTVLQYYTYSIYVYENHKRPKEITVYREEIVHKSTFTPWWTSQR